MSAKPDGIRLEAGPHAVLMLHGLGANSIELARLAKDLHAEGFTVIAPDLRGYCFGSPIASWQEWIDEVQAHHAQARHVHRTVSVVGLSMGATLALALAQRKDLTCAVMLSTALAYDGWSMPWYQFLSRFAAWIPFASRYSFREVEPFGVKNEEMRAMIKRAMARDHLSESGVDVLPVKYLLEGQRLIRSARDRIADVTCPALFVHSADDETVHPRNAQWAYEHIASKDKDILFLGDSYHMVTVDNERETVGQETLRFIKQAVNAEMGQPVFELPPVQSVELRRLLRKQR